MDCYRFVFGRWGRRLPTPTSLFPAFAALTEHMGRHEAVRKASPSRDRRPGRADRDGEHDSLRQPPPARVASTGKGRVIEKAVRSRFDARLRCPREPKDADWAFVVLPTEASETLPRRGRTTVRGTLDGHAFTALLEPDGRKGHWLRVDGELLEVSGATVGRDARFEIEPVHPEPDPDVPSDFLEALDAAPDARATWDATTTVARVDWIHWIASAKRPTTRAKRIGDACEMLSSGKKRVCCFDPSGFYSKAFGAPEAVE